MVSNFRCSAKLCRVKFLRGFSSPTIDAPSVCEVCPPSWCTCPGESVATADDGLPNDEDDSQLELDSTFSDMPLGSVSDVMRF